MPEKDIAVHICNTNLNNIGGAEESIKNLLSFNDPSKDKTNWLNISPFVIPSGINSDFLITNKIDVPFSSHHIPTLGEIVKVRERLEIVNPSVVVLNHPDFYSSSLFFGFPKELKEKTVALWRGIVERASDYIDYGSPLKKTLRKALWEELKIIQRRVGNEVGMNLATSKATYDSLINIGIEENKIKMIPHQIGGEYTPELRVKYGRELRRQFLAQDELGILIVSRISPEKGLSWVLSLYEKLRQEVRYKSPDSSFNMVRISVAGDASERNKRYFEKLKEEKVAIENRTNMISHSGGVVLEFLGGIKKEELQQRYNAYDLLFMPSPAEGFGRVTVEALSSGMPVIGRTGCGATEEILYQPPYAVGTTVCSPETAAAEILRLTNEPDTLCQLQSNASRWGPNYYTLDKAEKGFWNVIHEILPSCG